MTDHSSMYEEANGDGYTDYVPSLSHKTNNGFGFGDGAADGNDHHESRSKVLNKILTNNEQFGLRIAGGMNICSYRYLRNLFHRECDMEVELRNEPPMLHHDALKCFLNVRCL